MHKNGVVEVYVEGSKLKANKNVRADVFRGSTDLGKVSLIHLEVNTSEECQKSELNVQLATSNILILL